MKMNKKSVAIGLMAFFTAGTQACEKAQLPEASTASIIAPAAETSNQLQTAFAKSLARALKADPELRAFLKEQSTRMFDRDYDVLYQMVKDMPVNNSATFSERLARYTASSNELSLIESQLPLLTIFVPTLPSGFSANSWKTDNEIPQVAVRLFGTNQTPVYSENGNKTIIASNEIPGFPTVVVKQNERVVVNTQVKGTIPFYQNTQFSFTFSDNAFDGLKPANRIAYAPGFDSDSRAISRPNITAYNITTSSSNTQWQRDYVYYGITPSVDRGPLRTNFRETIRTFRLSTAGIQRISGNSDDPGGAVVGNLGQGVNYWTDGYYEFSVAVLYNAKDGSGDQTTVRFGVRPLDLYDLSLRRSVVGNIFIVTSVTPKECLINSPIASWDLKNFGTAWKYHVFEENTTIDVTVKSTVSSQYANNFELNVSGSIGEVKVGGKYGTSTTTTASRDVTLHYTQGSTDLGEKVSYFYDPIITGTAQDGNGVSTYNTYELEPGGTAGYVFLSVEPLSLIATDNYNN